MMRKFYAALTVAAIASLAGTAMADTTFLNTVGNGDAVGRTAWNAAAGTPIGTATSFAGGLAATAGLGVQSGILTFTGAGTPLTATVTAIAPSVAGTGFGGGTYGSFDQGSSFYTDSGDAPTPPVNALALAFGNNNSPQTLGYRADGIRLSFNPGVRGFAFNFEDIGDVGATMTLTWLDGDTVTTNTVTLGSTTVGADRDGFFGIVRSNATLLSIDLVQDFVTGNNPDDGFSIYNMTAVVPLPPAAYAGLASLAGVAILARRRKLAASK